MFGFGRKQIKISVITWDASFREHFHTVDFFGRQRYPKEKFEFIWVDFHKNDNPLLLEKISQYSNARILNLNNNRSEKWHLGKCINEGVRQSSGELLVIPDGDIAVDEDFLSYVWDQHQASDDLVMYFRRYDEQETDKNSREDVASLKKVCKLSHPLNYGGCLTIRKEHFETIKGYETHPVFAGPGMNGMETYTRLRNAGLCIKWAKGKNIYHPWHTNTLGSGISLAYKHEIKCLRWAKAVFPWINPGHFEQSWIVFCRERNLTYQANYDECNVLLKNIPDIDMDSYAKVEEFFSLSR